MTCESFFLFTLQSVKISAHLSGSRTRPGFFF